MKNEILAIIVTIVNEGNRYFNACSTGEVTEESSFGSATEGGLIAIMIGKMIWRSLVKSNLSRKFFRNKTDCQLIPRYLITTLIGLSLTLVACSDPSTMTLPQDIHVAGNVAQRMN